MPLPGRIPRPKHLFPELAAMYFAMRRWGLGLERFFHEDAGWYPIWTVGALTGTAGLMLTVLLFLFHDPTPVVGKLADPVLPLVTTPSPQPTPVVEQSIVPTFLHTPPRILETPKPTLQLAFQRLRVQAPWNELNHVQSIRSRAMGRARMVTGQDFWRLSTPVPASVFSFEPYFLRDHSTATSAAVVSPAPRFDPARPVASARVAGLHVEKISTDTAAIGTPFTYSILVRNTSGDVLPNVEVRERISALHRVSLVEPEARVEAEELVWQLNQIPPGAIRELKITLVPDEVTEIAVETSFAAISQFGTSARVVRAVMPEPVVPQLITPPAMVTPPLIEPEILPSFPVTPPPVPMKEEDDLILPDLAPSEAMVEPGKAALKLAVSPVGVLKAGETLTLTFQVSNVGTVAADNVLINVDLSPEFQHRYGKYVVHKIKRLEPGQTHEAVLRAVARKGGSGVLTAELRTAEDKEEQKNIVVPVQALEEQKPESKSPTKTSQSENPVETCGRPLGEELPYVMPQAPRLALRQMRRW